MFPSACSFLIPQDFCSDSPGGFEINLDHRKLKTPQAKLFTVPSEALAIAVATEWDTQKDTIKFYTMHLVSTKSLGLKNGVQTQNTERAACPDASGNGDERAGHWEGPAAVRAVRCWLCHWGRV